METELNIQTSDKIGWHGYIFLIHIFIVAVMFVGGMAIGFAGMGKGIPERVGMIINVVFYGGIAIIFGLPFFPLWRLFTSKFTLKLFLVFISSIIIPFIIIIYNILH